MINDRINIRATSHRRAVTMLEVISAMAVLATLIVVSAELLTLARAQRRGVVQRRVALVEAQNALEHVTATPSDAAGLDARCDRLTLSPQAEQVLPDGKIAAHAVASAGSAAGGYQVTAEVTWQLASGQSAAPVRLTTWVFPPLTNTGAEVEP